MESERLILYNSLVQLKSTRLQALAASGVAGIQYRHIVFLCHLIDSCEKRKEILLGIYILLPVSGEKDIFTLVIFLQLKTPTKTPLLTTSQQKMLQSQST